MSVPRLTSPFKNEKTRTQAGQTFTYVEVGNVIDRLNAVIGTGQWKFSVVGTERDGDEIVCHGRLEAMGGCYEQFGGATVKRYKADHKTNPNGIINLADDYKSSASDALKKCAAMIGVALYLTVDNGELLSNRFDGGAPIGPTPQEVEEGVGPSNAASPTAPSSTSGSDQTGDAPVRRSTSAATATSAATSGETGESSPVEGEATGDAPRSYEAAPKLEKARSALGGKK